MKKLALTIVAASLLAGVATAGTPVRFNQDGTTFVATDEERNGIRTIVGYEVQTGRPFQLRVTRGRVTGTYNNVPVSYRLSTMTEGMKTASR